MKNDLELIHFLQDLSETIRTINKDNGWNVLQHEEWDKEYKIPTVLMLMTTEIAEAMEAFRHDDIENFYEEISDVIIRIFDMVGGLPTSAPHSDPIEQLVYSIEAKLRKNRDRAYKHGGKRV